MTKLEQVECQLSHLLSLYEQRKNEPVYRIQLAMLAAQRRALQATRSDPSRKKGQMNDQVTMQTSLSD